ncbi:MAG TPA: Gfo/Idh/MocA family oxidoreductase [Gammaproteobacteria bacterium]
MDRIRIALIGIGKIARDQHVPALAANGTYELVAGVSRHQKLDGVPGYTSIEALLDAHSNLDAVAVCTPPQARFDIARTALQRGLHVMLEKPPGATLNEVHALEELAWRNGRALFAAWHSREAAGVEPARALLVEREIRRVTITWKEDVRYWHPGQAWIWQAGGLGVFDPAINALSIVTRILPHRLVLKRAELAFPENCQAPIAGELELVDEQGTPVTASLDFLQTGAPTWDIAIETDAGPVLLAKGGAVLTVGDEAPREAPDREYPRLYERFATLVRENGIDADVEPFRLVADAFLCARRTIVAPFVE